MKGNIIKKEVSETVMSPEWESFVEGGKELGLSLIHTKENEVPEIFKKYEYPVSAWPILINGTASGQLEKLCKRIPKLINQIPALYFDNDNKRIADFYFKGNEVYTQFALMCHNKNYQIACRLDLTYTEDGFKILEANIGSSIGGWQIHSFESIIRKMHPKLGNDQLGAKVESKNTQLLYAKFLIDKIVEYTNKPHNYINFFVSFEFSKDEKQRKESVAFFDDILNKELKERGIRGGAFSGDISKMKLESNGLFYEGKKVDCVLVLGLDEGIEIPPDVFRAFIMGHIYFPDHLGISMVSDKRNLGLLRELAEKSKFHEEDNELLIEGIPWTVEVKDYMVIYEKQDYNCLQLLISNKDKFVIKLAHGYQGKDVFIGKFSTLEHWKQIVAMASAKGKFIAQEFCESINFNAPNTQGKWVPHKFIWGAFGFGNTYGGVWVRMSDVSTDIGVINSATGAVEAMVYENK